MSPIRQAFDRFFWKATRALAPGLVNAQHPYLAKLDDLVAPDTRWLDIGCGHQLVPEWIKQSHERERELVRRAKLVVGIDLDLPSMRGHRTIEQLVLASADDLPFADGSFDLITANMVVEHIEHPQRVLSEICRVLSPGGTFLFHTPNRLNPFMAAGALAPQGLKNRVIAFLEDRDEDDVFPTHYRLNRTRDIRRLAEAAALNAADVRLVESSPVMLMLPPLMLAELVCIRLTRADWLKQGRSNIIAALRKPAEAAPAAPLDLAA